MGRNTATNRNARTLRRYASILALRDGASTEGERRAAVAAQERMLNSSEHFRVLVGDHPLANIDGFSWEILEVLASTWCEKKNGRKGDEVVERVLLRGFDWKALRDALRMHRSTMRAQWSQGRYVGTESLKRLNCQEYALEQALRAACACEGMTAEESAMVANRAR